MSFLGDYGVSSSGSGGGGGGGLTTAYEVDFSALPTQPIVGNGAVVIDGHNWIFANFANAASAGVVNGSGLQITVNSNPSVWTIGSYTAPVIYAPLTDFGIEISEITRVRAMMRFQVVNMDANFELVAIAISTPPVTAPEHITWRMQKGFNTTGGIRYESFLEANGVGGSGNPDNTNTADDVLGVSVSDLNVAEFFSGVYAGGFPANLRRRSIRSMPANTQIDAPDNNSDFNITLHTQPNSGLNNVQLIVQNLKIEYWT